MSYVGVRRTAGALLIGVTLVVGGRADAKNPPVDRLFGNEQYIVWTIRWWPQEPAAEPHVQTGPTVVVFAGNGTLRMKDGTRETHRAGEVRYFEAGTILNDGVLQSADEELSAMAVELRDPPPTRSWEAPETPAFPREGASSILDNSRVTVWDVMYEGDHPLSFHRHEKLTVFLFLTPGKFQLSFRSNRPPWILSLRSLSTAGAMPGAIDSEQAIGAPLHSIQIEVK